MKHWILTRGAPLQGGAIIPQGGREAFARKSLLYHKQEGQHTLKAAISNIKPRYEQHSVRTEATNLLFLQLLLLLLLLLYDLLQHHHPHY
jgi:hypothetical protein